MQCYSENAEGQCRGCISLTTTFIVGDKKKKKKKCCKKYKKKGKTHCKDCPKL